MELAQRVRDGERPALARWLSLLEADDPAGQTILDELFEFTGRAHVVGITGAPGTGKSTLASGLTQWFRSESTVDDGRRPLIAILAVDPTSPFSGGAILGDRIRMSGLSGDDGVFIRSMASRGAVGGLARRTRPLVHALDAAGFDIILLETVGAGQAEVDVASAAHTTIVVEAPGLGDEVQAIKAGILEIADILVVNKSDLAGAARAAAALQIALRQADSIDGAQAWQVPILQMTASEGEGIEKLGEAVDAHRAYLETSGAWQSRTDEQLEAELKQALGHRLLQRFLEGEREAVWQQTLKQVQARQCSPSRAVDELLQREIT